MGRTEQRCQPKKSTYFRQLYIILLSINLHAISSYVSSASNPEENIHIRPSHGSLRSKNHSERLSKSHYKSIQKDSRKVQGYNTSEREFKRKRAPKKTRKSKPTTTTPTQSPTQSPTQIPASKPNSSENSQIGIPFYFGSSLQYASLSPSATTNLDYYDYKEDCTEEEATMSVETTPFHVTYALSSQLNLQIMNRVLFTTKNFITNLFIKTFEDIGEIAFSTILLDGAAVSVDSEGSDATLEVEFNCTTLYCTQSLFLPSTEQLDSIIQKSFSPQSGSGQQYLKLVDEILADELRRLSSDYGDSSYV